MNSVKRKDLVANKIIGGCILIVTMQLLLVPAIVEVCFAKTKANQRSKVRSYAQLCIDASHYANVNQFDKSIAVATKGIKIAPEKAGCYRQRGLAYLAKRQYSKALRDLTRTTRLLPEFSYLWSELGFCYIRARNHAKAYPILVKSIELDPNGISANHNFIELGARLGKEKDARSIIQKAKSAKFNDLSRAILYENKNQSKKALLEYNKYLSNHKNSYAGFNYRGNFYRYRKEYKKALDDFNRIIALDPGERSAYYARAKTYQLLQKPKRAIEDCSTIIYMLPIHADARRYRAQLYMDVKEYKKAISDLTFLIGKRNWNVEGDLRKRGDCYFNLKQYKKAITDYSKAIDSNLMGGNKSTFLLRAKAYEKLGDFEKAKRDRAYASK